jgi:hypothetical protein
MSVLCAGKSGSTEEFLAMHIAKEQTRLLDAKPKELCAISQMIEKPQHLICLTHCF